MIITGRSAVHEAVSSGMAKKIFVRHGASVHFDNITVPFEVLNKSVFEKQFGSETQGVAALTDDFQYSDFNTILPRLSKERGIVLCDKIQDPHNFGAIIRASHCFGINTVIVPRYEQAKVTPAVYRASAGALFYVQVSEVVNLGSAIDKLKEEGFKIAAADMEGDTPLYKVSNYINYPLGVVIGSEGRGIRESILQRADIKLSIPMRGRIDSLNASMSAAIILYSLFRDFT